MQALKSLHVLDTPPEIELDEITTLASRICGTPISLITLVDENRQWFKSKVGLNEQETSRDISICAHTILDSKVLVVEDLSHDIRFQNNPMLQNSPHLRFYAGAPLTTSDGFSIGTLCVIDTAPKKLSAEQISSLEILSKQVVMNFERKKIERELIIQKSFVNKIVSVLPQLISYIDPQYNYLFRNTAHKHWFKQVKSVSNSTRVSDQIGAEAFAKIKPSFDQALAGNEVEFEGEIPLKVEGEIKNKWVHATYIPDINPHGKVLGFFGIITDLAEQKAREIAAVEQARLLKEALAQSQASEKNFRAYFEQSAIGMIRINSQMRFIDANPAYLKMMEYRLDELQKLSIFDITFPEDITATQQKVLESMTDNNVIVLQFQKRSITKSGKVIWVLTSGQVDTSSSADMQGYIMVQDITALKEAESLLAEQQTKLIHTSKMSALGEMAGGVAHEINNPLTIILWKIEKLKLIYANDRSNETLFLEELEKVRSTAVRIGKIVRGLQAFSRDDSSDPVELVPAAVIIADTVALCAERFASNGVRLITSTDSATQIECRSTEISQILLNLLNNAFDAVESEVDKWVKIETHSDEKMLHISVIDGGPGISQKAQEKLMQPFFTTKEVGRGTGLGLSIARGLALAHGGNLMLDTKADHTTFILSLPLRQAMSEGNTHE